jgi:hypothetical protein
MTRVTPRKSEGPQRKSKVKDLRGRAKMKITDIVAVLHKAATDMQAFATRNNDLNLPDPVVLPFLMNFLTDERLRKLSADGPSGGFQK